MKKLLSLITVMLLAGLAAQAATDYGFSVAGTTVTSDNCNNIVNNYITNGTVYYVPSSNTLYMNNVLISMTGDYNRVINNLENSGLKVVFSGTCTLYARDAAVIRIRKNTTLSAPSASTVVNINGVNENGIWMATTNDFSLTIQGPGTFNIKSTNNTAIEDEDNTQGTQLDMWHQVFFDNVNAQLSSGGNSVVKRVLLRFRAGSSVRFKATNNSSYPVINYCGWQLYGNEALLEPYESYYSNDYVYDSSGNKVYNKDVYVSDDYVAIINATNFPDANFRSWLLQYFPGYIHDGHVNNWGVFNLSGWNISNLKGIEYFTNLSSLNISNNNLTSVDLSYNTNLEKLYCSNNQLTSLNLNNQPNLEVLDCSNNKFTTLSLISKSYLTTLNCSNNTLLTTLYCYRNALTTLDVTGCTALKDLRCYENPGLAGITGLANCTAITYLDCEDCAITSLPGVNNMTNIATLLARNNQLTSLSVNGKSNLTNLRVNGNTTLTTLYCYRNALTTLNVTGCTGLTNLYCYENANLTTITGLADCTAITYLDCEDCKISNLSAVNSMNNIEKIYARNNQLTTLAVTGKSNLTYLRVSGNASLTSLQCYDNALTTVDFTNCPALTTASCTGNNLASLTVTGCTSLKELYCNRNRISGTAMTNLVNSLPTRSASDPGTFRVLNTTNENNTIDDSQLAIARGKYWNPKKWNGSSWVDITSTNYEASFSVPSMSATAGSTITLPISLNNTGDITSIMFDFVMPDGVEFISATMGSRVITSVTTFSYNSTDQTSNGRRYRTLLLYNNTGSSPIFTGNSGVILNITVKVPNTSGTYTYRLENGQFTPAVAGANYISMATASAAIIVTGGSSGNMRGDVNSNGQVDINDVTALINYVLTGNSSGINLTNANTNLQGGVDINDVTTLINYVLSGSW